MPRSLAKTRARSAGVLFLTAAAAACADGPSEPAFVAVPALVKIEAGDGQSALPGQSLALRPAVRVEDSRGDPVRGATVHFTVVEGGGTIERASATTDASGLADAGVWTLGVENGENALEAEVAGVAPVRFTATAESPFTIVARYVGTISASQRQAVERAIDRWSGAIVNDLPDLPLTADAGACFTGQPAIDEQIDDVLVFVHFKAIDGVGGTLGQAGPCFVRSNTSLPVMGFLVLDEADLNRLESVGLLDDVVLHEVGHVIGIGSLWRQLGLVSGAGGDDPRFDGPHAMSAFAALGTGGGSVPVENTGGDGTRDKHWREATFANELMTGFLNPQSNPLSAMTVASLRDLGYGTNPGVASDYSLFVAPPGAIVPSELIDLDETVVEPRYMIDQSGTRTPILYEPKDKGR